MRPCTRRAPTCSPSCITTRTACCRSRSPASRCAPSCTRRRSSAPRFPSGTSARASAARTCSCARSSRAAISRLTLAGNTCALMRGHGAVVVGASIERAVLTAIYLQVNANVLLQALPLGAPEALSRRGDRALGRSAVLAARARSKLGVFLPARRRRSVLSASGCYFRFLQMRAATRGFRIAAGGGRRPRRTRTTTLGDLHEDHQARSIAARSGHARRLGGRATAAATGGEPAAAAAHELLRDERRQRRRRQSRRPRRRRRALPDARGGGRPRQRRRGALT